MTLSEFREAANPRLTLRTVAQRAGISLTGIFEIEKRGDCRVSTFRKLVPAYGTDAQTLLELLSHTEKMFNNPEQSS